MVFHPPFLNKFRKCCRPLSPSYVFYVNLLIAWTVGHTAWLLIYERGASKVWHFTRDTNYFFWFFFMIFGYQSANYICAVCRIVGIWCSCLKITKLSIIFYQAYFRMWFRMFLKYTITYKNQFNSKILVLNKRGSNFWCTWLEPTEKNATRLVDFRRLWCNFLYLLIKTNDTIDRDLDRKPTFFVAQLSESKQTKNLYFLQGQGSSQRLIMKV